MKNRPITLYIYDQAVTFSRLVAETIEDQAWLEQRDRAARAAAWSVSVWSLSRKEALLGLETREQLVDFASVLLPVPGQF